MQSKIYTNLTSQMNKRLHIAHFTNTYYPVISGVVHSVSAFRKSLTDLGHNVFIFAQEAPDYEDEEPFVFRYPALNIGLPGDLPASIPFSPFISTLFPSLKVDVIHSHHPILLGQTAASKAEQFGLPLVFTYHSRYREYSQYISLNQEFVDDFIKDAIKGWVERYMRRCQHIVVPGESVRQRLTDEYGEISPVSVIPTGVDLDVFKAADSSGLREKLGWGNDKVLISVGRLALEKNWRILLKGAHQVIERRPDTRLIIIGDGDEREDLEQYARDLGISMKVHFTGKLSFEETLRYLKAADLFCFASKIETQGLVTMEALCAGLPVVAVDATGTRDVVEHGKEGLLTEDDPEALAGSIIRILADEGMYSAFKKAAMRKSLSYAIENQTKKLVEVYRESLEAKKANSFVHVESLASQPSLP